MLSNRPLLATLPAADLARAKEWYRDKLDLKPVEEDESGAGLWYETGGNRFLVYRSDFAGSNQATAAGWQVDDVAAAVAELRSRGVTMEEYDFGEDYFGEPMKTVDGILTLPDGRKAAWFKDSEANILSVNEM